MADFAFLEDRAAWINLDYVVRVDLGSDATESATIRFADGTTQPITRGAGKKLVKQLKPRKKKKKKKGPDETPPEPPAA